jgi:hypothetical protein
MLFKIPRPGDSFDFMEALLKPISPSRGLKISRAKRICTFQKIRPYKATLSHIPTF